MRFLKVGDFVLLLLCLSVPLCSGCVGNAGDVSGRDLGRALRACVSCLLVSDAKAVLTCVLRTRVLWEPPPDRPVLGCHLRLFLLPVGALLQSAIAYFPVTVSLKPSLVLAHEVPCSPRPVSLQTQVGLPSGAPGTSGLLSVV